MRYGPPLLVLTFIDDPPLRGPSPPPPQEKTYLPSKQAPKHFSPSLCVSSKTYDPSQMGAPKTLALPLNLPALPLIINDRSLKKVHRVLEFNQSPWLKQYIDFNTQKRTNAKNSFETDFFKLMNNSVFGKCMENVRKRQDIKLITSKDKLTKLASKPTYVSSKIFNENLVAVRKIKETLTLNRPAVVILGFDK